MSQTIDMIRFLPFTSFGTSGAPGVFLRVLQQLTGADGDYDDLNDGSHLPMVQSVRDLQRRVDKLDTTAINYRNKSSESTSALQGDLAQCDDPEAKLLTESLMRTHRILADYLEGLHPILREQKEAVKRLSEYLTPPTVELFQKKASHILKDAPIQKISMAKKNTCTICMDASANCIIKRTCCDSPSRSSSHQVRCERDMCKCGPTMCKDCLLTHYWTSTGKGSKSYARCVCCRAEFCLKDVFPVEYVEDEAYLSFKSEQERKAKEREVAKAKEEEEQEKVRGRRNRKSNLSANTTTTTTTTTTSSSSSSSSSSPSSYNNYKFHLPSHHYNHSHSFSNSYNNSEDTEDFGRKRRRTVNNNSNNSNNNSNTSNNSNNSNGSNNNSNNTTTCTYTNNNNHNNSNNNDDNDNSDNEGRSKYHLRSSRRSERQ